MQQPERTSEKEGRQGGYLGEQKYPGSAALLLAICDARLRETLAQQLQAEGYPLLIVADGFFHLIFQR